MIHDEGIPFAHLEELTLFYLYLRVSGSVVSDDRRGYMLQFDDNRSGIEHTTDLQGRHLPDHGISKDIDHFIDHLVVVSVHVDAPIGDEVGQPSRSNPSGALCCDGQGRTGWYIQIARVHDVTNRVEDTATFAGKPGLAPG